MPTAPFEYGPVRPPAPQPARRGPGRRRCSQRGQLREKLPDYYHARLRPAADLASGRLDPRDQALLAALAKRHRIRISCLHTGHSRFVKGTRRVSNHTVWRVVDLNLVDGQPVSYATGRHGRWSAGWTASTAPFPIGGRLSVPASAPALLQ
jgi:hypothetical protein